MTTASRARRDLFPETVEYFLCHYSASSAGRAILLALTKVAGLPNRFPVVATRCNGAPQKT
jgi:hypothetical protein